MKWNEMDETNEMNEMDEMNEMHEMNEMNKMNEMLYPEFLLSLRGHETLLLFRHGLLLHALAHISLLSFQVRLFAAKKDQYSGDLNNEHLNNGNI